MLNDHDLEMPAGRKRAAGKKTVFLLVLVLLLVCGISGGVYFFLLDDPAPPPQMSKPKKAAAKKGSKEDESVSAVREDSLPSLPKDGPTLEAVTLLMGEIEVLKKTKQAAELRKAINDLMRPPVAAVPQVKQEAQRAPSAREAREMKDREEQELKERKEKDARAAAEARRRARISIVSVHGVDGALSATVRDGTGKTTEVRAGSPLLGGKISRVTREGLVVDRGGKKVTLGFGAGEVEGK
jgi:hypothetical protein